MANPEHLKKLQEGVEDWNQWRRDNSDIRPNLRNADLSSANLYYSNLSGANLRSANLYYSLLITYYSLLITHYSLLITFLNRILFQQTLLICSSIEAITAQKPLLYDLLLL